MSHRAQVSDCAAIGMQREEMAKAGRRGASLKASEPVRCHGIHSRDGFLLATAMLLAACTAQPVQQQANTVEPHAPAAQRAPAAPAQPAPTPAKTDANVLTAEGYGPLTIGMTRAEITAALGTDSNPDAVGGADPEQCDQYRPARAPEGMLVMVEADRLTRISLIRDSRVKTDKGLGLGATPEQVRAAYGARLQSGPHKYEAAPAQYLVVWDKGGGPIDGAIPDASRGIVHEVNATGKVGAIHAGGPSVLYVEGCS